MGGVIATTPEEPTPPAQSVPERLLGIFVSPGSTFADIARKPDFLAPLIIEILGTVAVTETMLARIGMERIIRLSLEQSGRASRMSAEQMQQAVEQGAKYAGVITHVAGLLGTPIFLLIIAGLGLLILNGIFGAQANFQTAFSIACYAYLPSVIGALMALALILFGDPERFNAQNPVPSNAGFFLNPVEISKPLYTFLSSIDIFTIWLLILLALGFSEASSRKVKASPVFGIFLGIWMAWVLVKAGWAALVG